MSETNTLPIMSSDDNASNVVDTAMVDREEDDIFYNQGDTTVLSAVRKDQATRLCKTLWPLASNYEVHDRFVGSYNETIPAIITLSASDNPLEVIIRLPSLWGEDAGTPIIEQVATLHLVRSSTPVRVPEVIAYDTSSDNALESPYLIMERLPGQDLDMFLDDMTAEQRKTLAGELGQLYHQLRQIKSPYSGRITAVKGTALPSLLPGETLSHIPISMRPYAALNGYDGDGAGNWEEKLPKEGKFLDVQEEFVTSGGLISDPPNLPLLDMVTRAFNRRVVQFAKGQCFVKTEKVQFLRDMMDIVVDEGHVENPGDEYQLVHVDLFPRNIMVDLESSPMITGIIDWDEAVFAPSFVASVAPCWLWEPPVPEKEEGEEAEEQEEPWAEAKALQDRDKETLARSTRVPPTAELQEVKRAWEEAVGKECVESSRDQYAILARRMINVVTHWQWSWWMEDYIKEIFREWNVLRTEEEFDDSEAESEDEDNAESDQGSEAQGDEDAVVEAEDIVEDDGDSDWESCSEDEDEDEDMDDE